MFGCEKEGHDEEKHAERDCRAQWPVVCGAKEADDNIGNNDAAGATDEKRRKEVAESEHECEGGAGKERPAEKEKNALKCGPGEALRSP